MEEWVDIFLKSFKTKEKMQYPVTIDGRTYERRDITTFLKARAGEIIGRTLTLEHIPRSVQRGINAPLLKGRIREMFKEVAVECLATYFLELEERKEEVVADIAKEIKKYGSRNRVFYAALEQAANGQDPARLLEERVTDTTYLGCVALVRQEFAVYTRR
jgi:hypothetical protein